MAGPASRFSERTNMANSTQLRGVAREVIHAESITFWLERPNDSRVRVHVPPTSAQNLVEGEEVEVVGDFNVDGEFHAFSVERLTQPATRRPRIPSWGVYALAAASIAIVVLAGYLVLNRNRVPPLGPANGTLRGFRDLRGHRLAASCRTRPSRRPGGTSRLTTVVPRATRTSLRRSPLKTSSVLKNWYVVRTTSPS